MSDYEPMYNMECEVVRDEANDPIEETGGATSDSTNSPKQVD